MTLHPKNIEYYNKRISDIISQECQKNYLTTISDATTQARVINLTLIGRGGASHIVQSLCLFSKSVLQISVRMCESSACRG